MICINSLTKLAALTKKEMYEYIVYIDEITSFLELTQNDTMGISSLFLTYQKK